MGIHGTVPNVGRGMMWSAPLPVWPSILDKPFFNNEGYGNDSCEIGPLADLGFLGSHSTAKKQLSYLRPNLAPPSEMLRGCSVAICFFLTPDW